LYALFLSIINSHLGNSNFVLKKISLNIVDILTYLFNFSINEGIFPDCLKIAHTIPLFKKGDRKNLDNYRPISMLDPLSKIFEKAIKSRLLNYLKNISFLSNLQFGFREGRSTDDALLKFTSEIFESLNYSLLTSALFIDIKKAFDCVDHSILLEKLSAIGIRGNIHNLFKSYLSNRKQRVVIDDVISVIKDLLKGVPQGSVLGPILFLIYINSLLQQNFKGKLTAFADDVSMTYSATSRFELSFKIKYDIDLIRRWFIFNKLLLSPKTKIMFFSLSKNFPVINNIFYHSGFCQRYPLLRSFVGSGDCCDGCFAIDSVVSVRHLGLDIDREMKFSVHTKNLESYSLSVVRQFYYLKKFCSSNLLRKIYFALFQSKIQYGIVCWGGTDNKYLTPILIRQKCVLRLILNRHRMESSFELFKILKVLPLKHLFYFCTLKMFFKQCAFWQTRFSERYNLRSNTLNHVRIPTHNLQHFLNCYKNIAPRIFNKVPRRILENFTLSRTLLEIKLWLFNFDHVEIKNIISIIA
jgi:hypothetical protein